MNKRIWHLDLVRAFCVIWIVAFWHNGSIIEHNYTTNFITDGVLGAFTLLSGLLLSRKCVDTFQGFYVFWWDRIKRLYVFFFISALLCFLVPYLHTYVKSFNQFINAITFMSCFTKNMPNTLWYVCVIFLYYFLAPFVLIKKSVIYRIIISLVILLLFVFLYHSGNLYPRVLTLWPAFAFGMIVGVRKNFNVYNLILLFLCVSIVYYLGSAKIIDNSIINTSLATFFLALFIENICRWTNNIKINEKFYNLIINISYSSMLMYLFHRQWFLIDKGISKLIYIRVSYLNILLLPLFILICYYVQKWYDKKILKKDKL